MRSTIATENIEIVRLPVGGTVVHSCILIAKRDISKGEVLGYDYGLACYWDVLEISPRLFDKSGNLITSSYQSKGVHVTVRFAETKSLKFSVPRISLSDASKINIIVNTEDVDGIRGFFIPNVVINERLEIGPSKDHVTFIYQGEKDEEVLSDQDLYRLITENNKEGSDLFEASKYIEAEECFNFAIKMLDNLFKLLNELSVDQKVLDELQLSFASVQYNRGRCICEYARTGSEIDIDIAVRCFRSALSVRRELLPADHDGIKKVEEKLKAIQDAKRVVEAVATVVEGDCVGSAPPLPPSPKPVGP